MTMNNSIPPSRRSKPAKPRKPPKPYPEFPLFAHANGQWSKKIRGRQHHFGVWADPQAALDNYNRQKDDLHAGRRPRDEEVSGGVEVRHLCNAWWNHQKQKVLNGELSPRTFQDYERTTDLIAATFGKSRLVDDLQHDEFAALRNKMAKQWGPHMLGKIIQCIRSLFKYGYEAGMLDRPMRFGPGFKRPTKKTMRLERSKAGKKLFTANEVRRILDDAGCPLNAMILLAINCGYGNTDCATLKLSSLDLDAGWVDYPRPKTGIPRRCPLWPETVEAIRAALAKRPKVVPKEDDAELVFLTRRGARWVKPIPSGIDDSITKETAKVLKALGINGRKHLNFYSLRHTFRTVADRVKDQPAADFIMGHESTHMSNVYREEIDDERLQAVTDYVRGWLWPDLK